MLVPPQIVPLLRNRSAHHVRMSRARLPRAPLHHAPLSRAPLHRARLPGVLWPALVVGPMLQKPKENAYGYALLRRTVGL